MREYVCVYYMSFYISWLFANIVINYYDAIQSYAYSEQLQLRILCVRGHEYIKCGACNKNKCHYLWCQSASRLMFAQLKLLAHRLAAFLRLPPQFGGKRIGALVASQRRRPRRRIGGGLRMRRRLDECDGRDVWCRWRW